MVQHSPVHINLCGVFACSVFITRFLVTGCTHCTREAHHSRYGRREGRVKRGSCNINLGSVTSYRCLCHRQSVQKVLPPTGGTKSSRFTTLSRVLFHTENPATFFKCRNETLTSHSLPRSTHLGNLNVPIRPLPLLVSVPIPTTRRQIAPNTTAAVLACFSEGRQAR